MSASTGGTVPDWTRFSTGTHQNLTTGTHQNLKFLQDDLHVEVRTVVPGMCYACGLKDRDVMVLCSICQKAVQRARNELLRDMTYEISKGLK